MNKRRNFEIARITEEPKKEKPVNKIATPYGGTNVKDVLVYPNVEYGNNGKQYKDLDIGKKDETKVEDKYSKDRIPSYYRSDGEGNIRSSNIASLRGDKLDKEAELVQNRQIYGSYYKNFQEQNYDKQESKNEYNREVDKIHDPLFDDKANNQEYVFEEVYDDEDSYDNEDSYESEDLFSDDDKIEEVNRVEKNIYPQRESNVNKPKENNTPNIVYNQRPQQEINKPANNKQIIDKTPTTPKRRPSKYVYPPIEILKRANGKANSNDDDIKFKISVINRVLEDFKIGGRVCNFTKGPTVTQFEVKLDPGVNVNKISAITKNLQMSLKSKTIRIEAPIPGEETVGIEVPNKEKETVYLGDLIAENIAKNKKETNTYNGGLPLNAALGLSISGEKTYIDVAEMPHGIIAGATGGGKTICIYSIITSILFQSTPDEVKFVLVDPKKNELMYFDRIPHLATPVIDDAKIAVASLKWCVDEMERRYDFLKANRKRSIGDYNEMAKEEGLQPIPYIVVVIDEFADLVNVASDSLEISVQRLTQKARSAGIHLLIATQRPSTDVISGTIKNNVKTRIAFQVASFVDSQTILDHSGAEKLLGKGDMLLNSGAFDTRIQGTYVSDKELEALAKFFDAAEYKHEYMFTHEDLQKQAEQSDSSEPDVFGDVNFDEIARFVFRSRKASANQIQNTYHISFNRANRIIVGLAQLGIVSSENIPGKAREVLIEDIELLENILENKYN